MTLKLIGAIFVILGCGGFGFLIAQNAQKEISTLRQFISALDFMECELSYRMTPLPQLCRLTSSVTDGCIRKVFRVLASELDKQSIPQVVSCVTVSLQKCPSIPPLTRHRIVELGRSLGCFDLSGQVKCIKAVHTECTQLLNKISSDHALRCRSYRTLGLCTGAALSILFI